MHTTNAPTNWLARYQAKYKAPGEGGPGDEGVRGTPPEKREREDREEPRPTYTPPL